MILALDGGSTKTLAVVMDEKSLELKGVGLGGSANYTTGSPKHASIEMENAIKGALNMSHIKLSEIKKRIFAIAGIGDSLDATNQGRSIVNDLIGDNFEVMNDGISAYYLGNLNHDGIVFAPGTGSVGYVKKRDNMRRIGGWGWAIGDFSAAIWIVKKGIEVAMFEEDSGEKDRLISKRLNTFFGCSLRELVWKVETKTIPKDKLSSFAPELAKLASEGYPPAFYIFKKSAEYISSLTNEIINEFREEEIEVSLVGGTMLAGDFYLNLLKKNMTHKFQTFFGYQVVIGALIYALRKFDSGLRESLAKQLDTILLAVPQKKLQEYLKF
ncbi:MAG: N-acetylglucosamine kinase [Thermoplasmatales archaeon]|nr:N-acetylglucosamine kinase [Thermoplasmatales archaeon]